jgi:hypothetical protein
VATGKWKPETAPAAAGTVTMARSLWYNLPPQSVVPFALDSERKGLNENESIAH